MIGPGSLDIDRELVPTALTNMLTVLPPWLVVPGYDGLTHQLRTCFGAGLHVHDYRDGELVPAAVDVLRVPYDFRRSVATTADHVGRAVAAALGRDSDRQVVVVAHSLGGLVARYWIGVCGGWRHCRALITLGTPHRGAPRAVDWLFNGAGVGALRSAAATRVLRDWPSVYELLPQYPAVLTESGTPVEVPQLSPTLVGRSAPPARGRACCAAPAPPTWCTAQSPTGGRRCARTSGRGWCATNALRTLVALYCDRPALQEWVDVLADIDARGQHAVFADMNAATTAADLVRGWFTTPSWNASQAFLLAHPELREPDSLTVVEQWSGDQTVRQHLAILHLVEHLPVGAVFDAVLDPTDARDLLLDTARTGDPQLVAEVWFAAPHLANHTFAGPLAVALYRALSPDEQSDGDGNNPRLLHGGRAGPLTRMSPRRTLTTGQLSALRRLADALRRDEEHEATVLLVVQTIRVRRAGGTHLDELARALDVDLTVVRGRLDEHRPTPRRQPRADALAAPWMPSGSSQRNQPGADILACSGDARPGGNDLTAELAAIRSHAEPRFCVTERSMIEIAELPHYLDLLRPTLVHLAANSSRSSTATSPVAARSATVSTQRASRSRATPDSPCPCSSVKPGTCRGHHDHLLSNRPPARITPDPPAL